MLQFQLQLVDLVWGVKGNTVIGKNALIESNSFINNAKIYDYAKIEGAYVEGAVVQEKAKIKRGAKLFSQTAVKKGVVIGQDCILSNAIIGEYSMIGKNTVINYLNCHSRVSIGDNCLVSANQNMPVEILEGASIEERVTLLKGVKIEKEQKVKEGTSLA